ncbi:MAG: hypothetical protein JST70_16895 [Bacteroidetes bacterium]|nr:hypothetical protein [Bacteroidota bacterium]
MKRTNFLFASAFALAIGGAALTHASSIKAGNAGFQNPNCQSVVTDCATSGMHDCDITVYSDAACKNQLTRKP